MNTSLALNTSSGHSWKAIGSALLLLGTLISSNPLAANQNSVLAKFETAPSNWTQAVVEARINEIDSASDAVVALGDTVTVSVDSSVPASFILAIVNTYGDVKIIKPAGVSSSTTHQFQASSPVGQYSLFAFASDPEISNAEFGMPTGQTQRQLAVGMKSVETFIGALNRISATHQIAKGAELQFNVEDSKLAMRGLRKRISKMKDKKAPPVVIPETTPPVVAVDQPVIEETKAAVSTKDPGVAVVTKDPGIAVVATSVSPSPQPAETVLAANTVATTQVELMEVKPEPVPVTVADNTNDADSLSLDIKFQLNSDALTASGVNALDTLGSALLGIQRSSELPIIMLEGHTDDTGDANYNLRLSENRANSARSYLLERFGLPEDSIMAAGFGETSPKIPDTSVAARRANRRVELRVVQ